MRGINYIVISIGLISLLLIIIIIRKTKKVSKIGVLDYQKTFNNLTFDYGLSIARNVEKIYRLETDNFKSNIYKQTGSAGMLAFDEIIPYGWVSLETFWRNNKSKEPVGIYNSDNGYNYLQFAGNGGFYTLAEFLRLHGNNAGRWNSLNEQQQIAYNETISNIETIYT